MPKGSLGFFVFGQIYGKEIQRQALNPNENSLEGQDEGCEEVLMGMMAQTLPPLPSSAAQPPEVEAPPLAQAPQEAPMGNAVQNVAQTIMRQLMDQRRMNDALAEQYPPAARDFQQANEALKAAMLKIVQEVQQTPGSNPAPPVGMG